MTTESKPPMRQIAELIDGIATARAESAERLLGECETQLIETRAHLGDMVGQLGHREAEIARLKEYADAANETAGNAIREVIDLRRANAQLDATIARLEAKLAAERERTTTTQRARSRNGSGRTSAPKSPPSAERSDTMKHTEKKKASSMGETALRRELSAANADADRLAQTVADRDAEIARLKAELAETRADLASLQCALFATPEQLGGHVKTAAPPAEDPRIAALCVIVRHLTHHTNYRGNQAFDDAFLVINEGRR